MKTDPTTGRILANNLTGMRFDRLTVLRVCPKRAFRGRIMWECICKCGNRTVRRGDYLLMGRNQSCGCLRNEISRETRRRLQTTHGLSDTPTGNSWMAMMDRCFNPKSKDWSRYGGAGRTVCEFLKASPLNLLSLIGERPAGTSIDRTNNSGYYTCGKCAECKRRGWPLNVRWGTLKDQASNRK